MSNSTSRFSMSKDGSNSNRSCKDSRKNKNTHLQESEWDIQDLHVDLYESTLQSHMRLNNLDNLLSSFTPFVAATFTSEPRTNGIEPSKKPYFVLEDLWDSFKEWSAYGVQVPLSLANYDEPVLQYYAPSLSALQLYDKDERFKKSNTEESSSSLSSNAKTKAKVLYQYFEFTSPHERISLYKKVSNLAMKHPFLKTIKSSDISPCSWFSVAWYPIYGIPPMPNNKEASFLTFHNLSTPFISKKHLKLNDGGPLQIRLRVFGLTTYKLEGSVLTLPEASESQQMNSLLKAADVWLENLNVYHHDHSHFIKKGKQWIDE